MNKLEAIFDDYSTIVNKGKNNVIIKYKIQSTTEATREEHKNKNSSSETPPPSSYNEKVLQSISAFDEGKSAGTFQKYLLNEPLKILPQSKDIYSYSVLEDINESSSSFATNRTTIPFDDSSYFNQTQQLISILKSEDFEYGKRSFADIFVENQLEKFPDTTKLWLANIFTKYYHDIDIVLGILRVVSRMDIKDTAPNGLLIVLGALPHQNIEIQECAIRALENWGTPECLNILKNAKLSINWLEEYRIEVIKDLENSCHRYS
ncbi:hypothetical protein P1X15_31295 [Runella sp. MFBS21]|uniref:hypothetical protein n=1 Tax=Runella sp. MFBS21 TaxID=3034018 RepID=UPI0023F82FBD|nr:hypothetical protein [Runella sp. MFBS21]MDF7822142.1 hypothetical protein [Runella sp. MFBS21]